MKRIAILLTVHDRCAKTLACLDSVASAFQQQEEQPFGVEVFLTDDGSSDGTTDDIQTRSYPFPVHILQADGSLFWNGGMINSWRAALESRQDYDGYLWLNNDTIVLPHYWNELIEADRYCRATYGCGGIYVGSTKGYDNGNGEQITYGGFNFTNPITLKDEFVVPNGNYQPCQCAHGNLTYVSQDVVAELGIFTDEYIHSGGDHDYTYRAYKHGTPLLVLPSFVGICENDHPEDGYAAFMQMSLKERLHYLKSPLGFNLHNTLVFQRRCFPYRYPFVWVMGHLKALFPKTYWRIYQWLRH